MDLVGVQKKKGSLIRRAKKADSQKWSHAKSRTMGEFGRWSLRRKCIIVHLSELRTVIFGRETIDLNPFVAVGLKNTAVALTKGSMVNRY